MDLVDMALWTLHQTNTDPHTHHGRAWSCRQVARAADDESLLHLIHLGSYLGCPHSQEGTNPNRLAFPKAQIASAIATETARVTEPSRPLGVYTSSPTES
eukprot:2009817-Amphidinium_carterae.2